MRNFLLLMSGTLAILALAYWHFVFAPQPKNLAPRIHAVKPPAKNPTNDAASETDRVILSLFNPDAAELNDLTAEKRLRERYHTVYVSLYLLKGCGENVDEYHRAVSAHFSSDWANLGKHYAASTIIHQAMGDILKQASGSYSLLYQNTPCEKRNLPAVKRYFESLD